MPPCFTRNICCLFWGFPVLRSPDAPPTTRLDFFLLLPSQMQVLQLSLHCLRLCILSCMEIACHPMCCELCLWFWATARVTRSTGGWASLEGPEGPRWHFSHVSPKGHTHPKSWIKASHKTRPDFRGGRLAPPPMGGVCREEWVGPSLEIPTQAGLNRSPSRCLRRLGPTELCTSR